VTKAPVRKHTGGPGDDEPRPKPKLYKGRVDRRDVPIGDRDRRDIELFLRSVERDYQREQRRKKTIIKPVSPAPAPLPPSDGHVWDGIS